MGLIPGLGRSPGGGRGNPLQYSCLENSMTEKPGRLQFMGSQRVGHDWANFNSLAKRSHIYMWSEMGGCAQSLPTLCNPMDCSLPGSSVHVISQARVLEWVAISFSGDSSWPGHRTRVSWVSYTTDRFFTTVPIGKPMGDWAGGRVSLGLLGDEQQWVLSHLVLEVQHACDENCWLFRSSSWLSLRKDLRGKLPWMLSWRSVSFNRNPGHTYPARAAAVIQGWADVGTL